MSDTGTETPQTRRDKVAELLAEARNAPPTAAVVHLADAFALALAITNPGGPDPDDYPIEAAADEAGDPTEPGTPPAFPY